MEKLNLGGRIVAQWLDLSLPADHPRNKVS